MEEEKEIEIEEELGLQMTPTWIVAVICTIIIAISLLVERCIHFISKYLKRKHQKPLFEALEKVKEELMLLGFISLMLTMLQVPISNICVPHTIFKHMLPCKSGVEHKSNGSSLTEHPGRLRRRLLSSAMSGVSHCAMKGKDKVPFLSFELVHQLHIFIFVLAVVHVTFSVSTVLFGGLRIHQWKHWEDYIAKEKNETNQALIPKITHVHGHAFIRGNFMGISQTSTILAWMHSFFKQFYGAVTKVDYLTLRMGFIMTHCKGNPKFNFYKYMIRALEDDFKHVAGINWYLWIFVIVFLLLNVNGWHTYFWISFIPFILLIIVATKLEHVITMLAHEVAEKHVAIEGELVVELSDEHFWFNRPKITLYLIHFILFQNAFEIAYLVWIWMLYGLHSCIMERLPYIVPRLVIGILIQVLCSYSTLPLYAIVTQMGSTYKKAIFEEHVQAGILGWREKAKRKKRLRYMNGSSTQSDSMTQRGSMTSHSSNVAIQLGRLFEKEDERDNIQEIENINR